MVVSDRGQAHTVEAFSGAVVLLATILFALQVTAVTPLTASTASQHIENQQSGTASGVLDEAAESGTLKETLLYWNDEEGVFYNATRDSFYTKGGPSTPFGQRLNETFLERGIAFNLEVSYVRGDNIDSFPIVNLGTPSDNAVTVRRSVTIFDDDNLYEGPQSNVHRNSSLTVRNASSFYAGTDEGEDSPVYNVFEVELTLWRM